MAETHDVADGGTGGGTPEEQQAQPCPSFPPNFMKGIGMSVWQNSSDGHEDASAASNWANYTKRKKFFGQQELGSAWHTSNDFWNM
jgi:hypothetical protein